MCMKLALLASTVHLPRINITKHILFTLKHDAILMRCPVSEDEIEHTNNEKCRSHDEPIEWHSLTNRNGILFELVKKILAKIAGGNGAISAKTGNQRESVWQQNWTTLPAPRQQSRTRQIEALFTVCSHVMPHIYGRVQHGKRTYPAWKENKKWEFVAADNRVYRML